MHLPSPEALLYFLLVISAVLIATIAFRPAITDRREGKMLAFVAFLILPVLCMSWGASEHIDRSKQTTFCLSCHIMESHGKSLYVDDPSYLAAAHFQNHRIPVDEACYTCHTDYALYGGVIAKMRGLRHIYIQYLGTPPSPDKITLYSPYNNRECLYCHLGARSFESNPIHMAILDTLKSNQTSCMTSGCHDTVHNVASLDSVKFWSPGKMNIEPKGIQHSLRISGILLILGFMVEFISLLWEKPLAFILFAFVGGTLFLAGILVYLYSLVSERG